MALAITTTFAMLVWIALWATGVSGFDGLLVALLIVTIVAGARTLTRFATARRRAPGRSPQGGW